MGHELQYHIGDSLSSESSTCNISIALWFEGEFHATCIS